MFETTPERKGRAAVLAGRRAVDMGYFAAVVATPPGPITIFYRDDVTNETTLAGTVRYRGELGRDHSVPFIVENERNEKFCDGTFSKEGPSTGKFSLSCVGGFRRNGTYERKNGDPNDSFIARGQTARGLPITLVIGRPTGAS